jgi:protein-S-isoprenylcysteine O-methyltransferase Ste14
MKLQSDLSFLLPEPPASRPRPIQQPMPAPTSHPLALRVPPVAVTVIAGVLAGNGAETFPALTIEYGARPWVAAALWAAGAGSCLAGVVAFRRACTTVNPLTPASATTLVTTGLYRLTRHPMYLGFLLFLLAEIAWLANPVAFLVAPAFVLYLNRFQIEPEERALRARFGPAYRTYAAQVRRWI